MKRFLIGFFLLLGIMAAALLAAVKSPAVLGMVMQKVLEREAGKAAGPRVRVGSVLYSFPDNWTLGDVSLSIALKGGPLRMTAHEVRLQHVRALVTGTSAARLAVDGADVSFSALKARDADIVLDLTGKAPAIRYTGRTATTSLFWDKAGVTALKAGISGSLNEVLLHDLTAALYGGMVSGKAQVSLRAPCLYTADVAVNGVDAAAIAGTMGGVFNELGGGLSGQLRITGRGAQVDALDTSWSMPAGGSVSASLLSSVMAYIPATREKKKIETLIAVNGKLAVEVFSFTLRNDRPDHFGGEIGIRSREANLELNVTHDVNVDGRVDELLKAWKTVFR